MKTILSPDNDFIRELRKLKMRKYRWARRQYLAEGTRLVTEALRSGACEILLVEQGQEVPPLSTSEPQVIEVGPKAMRSMCDTETPQGLVAVCRMPDPATCSGPQPGMWLAADAVSDPGNLGTMLRTAWGVGARGILLLPGCVDPYAPKVVRSSMGAVFFLSIVEAETGDLRTWKEAGKHIVVADARGDKRYWEAIYPEECVIIVGSEAAGVSPESLKLADEVVRLPLAPGVDSLNAAVAAGVVLYEARRQREG